MLKEGFIIRVEKVYLWKNLPIAKILFYDCKYYGDIIKNVASPEASRMITSFFQVSFACQPHRILADQKVKDCMILIEKGNGESKGESPNVD